MWWPQTISLLVLPDRFLSSFVSLSLLVAWGGTCSPEVRVCRQFLDDKGIDAINWPSRSPDLNPIEHLWNVMYRLSNAAKYLLRLSRSSLMPWSRSGTKSPRTPSTDSSGAYTDVVGSAYRQARPYKLLSHMSCCGEFHTSWISLLLLNNLLWCVI